MSILWVSDILPKSINVWIGPNSNNRLANRMYQPHYPPRPSQASGDTLQQETTALQTFLQKLQELHPVIPDPVINNIIAQAGFATSDQRVARIFNVATQKFIVDVLSELPPGTLNVQLDMIKHILALRGLVSHRPEVVLSAEGDEDRGPIRDDSFGDQMMESDLDFHKDFERAGRADAAPSTV
jgi:hypothetical protein